MMHDRNTQHPWLENKAETFPHPENYEGHINRNSSKKWKIEKIDTVILIKNTVKVFLKAR